MVVDYGRRLWSLSPPGVEQSVGHHGGSGGRGGSSDSDRELPMLRGCECDSKALMVLLGGVLRSVSLRRAPSFRNPELRIGSLTGRGGLLRRRKHKGQG